MGQYYKPVIIYDDGKMLTAKSHDFDVGLKLMEQSWVGNNFVNAVAHLIEDKPARVAWIGDYANVQNGCSFGDGFISSPEDFQSICDGLWYNEELSKVEEIQEISPDAEKFLFDLDHADCFLVNETKGCFIDLEKYVKKNVYAANGWTHCVNPLPLLTCMGNGMGGGDYFSDIGKADIGSWAFDVIYITSLKPGNLEEVEYTFQEKY